MLPGPLLEIKPALVASYRVFRWMQGRSLKAAVFDGTDAISYHSLVANRQGALSGVRQTVLFVHGESTFNVLQNPLREVLRLAYEAAVSHPHRVWSPLALAL